MKKLAFLLFTFLSISARAQTLEEQVIEAGNLFLKGDYKNAIPASEKAAASLKAAMGEDNILYIGLLTIQASSYKFTFQYDLAENIYLQLKPLILKVNGEHDESYTSYLNNLAGLYENMGQYQKAEPLFIEALAIRKKITGSENDEAYSTCMNGLAALYHTLGQYAKAEPLYIKVVAIRKTILGEQTELYATALNNLATLYFEMGQYEKSESLYQQANTIQKNIGGENTAAYALGLNNIASLWQELKQFKKAEAAFIQSASIRKKILGTDHADYAGSLNNLATLYADQKLFTKAEPLLVEATAIWKKTAGSKSALYATGLNNLGALYRKLPGQAQKSESYYLQALQMRKEVLGENHPLFSDTQNDLGLLYMQTRQYEKAESLFLSSSRIMQKNIASNFPILSDKEKANYLDYNKSFLECNNSYAFVNRNASPAILENNYNLELNFKSYSLADTRIMLEVIRNSRDSSLRKIFTEWNNLKNFLARQYALPLNERANNLGEKEAQAERLEKELNRNSSEFSSKQRSLNITMQDVREHLEEKEAAIEFVRFRLYNKNQTDSFLYAAYILRKQDAAPQFVYLCEEKQLKRIFDSAGVTANRMVKSLYRGPGSTLKEQKLGIRLYQLIWLPMEPYLQGMEKIAYSPAGSLYGIAFHAMTIDTSRILMDKYQLRQYTSTRQVALRNMASEAERPGGIILFGDALFSMDSLQLVKKRKATEPVSTTVFTAARGTGLGMWSSLPGTAEEIKAIKELFEQNKIHSAAYISEDASEDNLKNLSGSSPQILHIATHGFFLPQPEKGSAGFGNVYSLSNDPLLRSGLVLSGGNYVWSGNTPVQGIEDGIVTAYEISQLNLDHTVLVVLSACETALGDIKGTEGVFGLQRGFKMAGTSKMIVSLWQVPDKETSELMTLFYSNWLGGKSINDSFYGAQGILRKKYPAYYWAAFVLVE